MFRNVYCILLINVNQILSWFLLCIINTLTEIIVKQFQPVNMDVVVDLNEHQVNEMTRIRIE